MAETIIQGRPLVAGRASGPLLYAATGLSFWGGVDPVTGMVIDAHHPLHGEMIAKRILALPSGRGSCNGSAVLLELIANGHAPAGLVLASPDEVLTLGALIGETTFGKATPVICVAPEDFERLALARHARLDENGCIIISDPIPEPRRTSLKTTEPSTAPRLLLTSADAALLAGEAGEAAGEAMRVVCRMAEIAGAERLLDVTRVHVDGCIYTGPAGLAFARRLMDLGGPVRVPTTLNAISVDRRQWRAQGIDPVFGAAADALAQAYVDMGAAPMRSGPFGASGGIAGWAGHPCALRPVGHGAGRRRAEILWRGLRHHLGRAISSGSRQKPRTLRLHSAGRRQRASTRFRARVSATNSPRSTPRPRHRSI